jgi:hypothetical protein
MGFQSKLLLNLIWPGLGWPLLAGSRCSEVAVSTGLTVFRAVSLLDKKINNCSNCNWSIKVLKMLTACHNL